VRIVTVAKSKVYFTDMSVSMERPLLVKFRHLLEKSGLKDLPLKDHFVAIKTHFGEFGNLAALRPNYARVLCDYIKELGGRPFLTDCNTLYVGGRKNALDHLDTANFNGYSVITTGVHNIIADGLKGNDEVEVPVEGGEYIKKAKIGRAIMDADVFISLSHFKGHEMAGFGGALKNIGMGSGSRAGKMDMHCAGKPTVNESLCVGCRRCQKICAHNAPTLKGKVMFIDHDKCVGCGRCLAICPRDAIEANGYDSSDIMNRKIAEYSKAVIDKRPHFHISLAIDITPTCDCHADNPLPIVPNVGMFASADPVAIDVACADMVNKQQPIPGSVLAESTVEGGDHFYKTAPVTNWRSCVEHAQKIGIGSMDYELIKVN